MTRAALLVATALLLAGCGSGSGDEKPEAMSAACAPSTGTTEAQAGAGPSETMFLTNVEVEAMECADRVVFGFEDAGQPPGFRVYYQPGGSGMTEDGSGRPLEIAGSALLVVRLEPAATARTEGEELELTYTGPRRISVSDDGSVREVVKTGDFEAVVTWAIGLDEELPFTVSSDDSRLVVDIG